MNFNNFNNFDNLDIDVVDSTNFDKHKHKLSFSKLNIENTVNLELSQFPAFFYLHSENNTLITYFIIAQTFDCDSNIFNHFNNSAGKNLIELKFSNGRLNLKDPAFDFIESTFLFELAVDLNFDATFILNTRCEEHNRIHIDLSIKFDIDSADQMLRKILSVCINKHDLKLHNLVVL
jgi:hypothetical protein